MMPKKWKAVCPSSKDSILEDGNSYNKKEILAMENGRTKNIRFRIYSTSIQYLLLSYYGTDYSQQLDHTSEQKN